MRRFTAAKMTQVFHFKTDLHLARKLWHVAMGLLIAGGYASWLPKGIVVITLTGFFLAFLVTELVRIRVPLVNKWVMIFFAPLMRKSEIHQVSGCTYFLASSLLAVALFPKDVAVLSILFLALADPLASVFGILFGEKSIQFKSGRTLIGTTAGVMTCFFISVLFFKNSGMTGSEVFLISALGGIAGGTAELLPFEVDDNFSIPMVSGLALWSGFLMVSFFS
jgi:diacylglycerol kinase (CTP)